ncbi:DUF1365 family protein [Streptomyces sp. NPDC001717]|uniref:DUF1365 family protein n=1 Tax=Streptomyces sp. NPDC001717 TaxID=3364604 RepID=UPI0036B7478F
MPTEVAGAPHPALHECVIAHTRTTPLRHSFRHRTHLWCADLDRLPSCPARCARSPGSTPATTSPASPPPSTGIRRHGIALLMRGRPVHPRPRSTPQKGMLP